MPDFWKDGAARNKASFDDLSTELVKSAEDFETKILQPVREKRAARDEVLVTQGGALGSVRNPQWDGVVDGEVCGEGALAECIRTFLYWVPIKLRTNDALRLCVSCGDALVHEGEFSCARDKFYRFVTSTCGKLERDRVPKVEDFQGVKPDGTGSTATRLKSDEACWAARAEFGVAAGELCLTLTRDPHVRFPSTLLRILRHLRGIQRGMDLLLRLPTELHDSVSWLVLEGTVLLFDWCEPLTVLGYGGSVAEFLTWCVLAMESIVNLSTVKHLPWRMRLTVATCDAFENAGKLDAAARCIVHELDKVKELRRQEGMDPPIPPHAEEILDSAQADLRLLHFKFAVLTAAKTKRPAGTASNGGTDDGSKETLAEDELASLLEQHIPNHTKRPVALLELMGSARGTDAAGGGTNSPGLTPHEASTVCKSAISALISAGTRDTSTGASTTVQDGEEKGQEHMELQAPFPLDIDQEMQLMRKVYQLEEFDLFQSLLPSTKQRLRDAQTSSCSRDDYRSFWFEIALWTACMRLPTWRDKPVSQIATPGGLKRAGTGVNAGGSSSLPESKDLTSTSSYGGRGDETPSLEPGMSDPVQTVDEEEGELRDALLGTRPAEVVAIALEETGRPPTKINIAPLVTVMYLIREALFGSYHNVLEMRGDSILAAVMSAWEPYVESILRALDTMPAGAEVERPLLDALLLSLEMLHVSFSMLDADDASLRATIALRLAILQADFQGDQRKACQTLRSGLAAIDKYRQASTSVYLHMATGTGEVMSDLTQCLDLARSSVTASFSEGISAAVVGTADPGRDGATETGRYWTSPMVSHELAALQLDITSTLFRIEMLMGRAVASSLEKKQTGNAGVKLPVHQNGPKYKEIFKVTFEGSGGHLDTPNGSLAMGWTVSMPPATKGSLKALVGANAVVYAAGAGPLGTTAAATPKVTSTQDLELKIASKIEGLGVPGAMAAEPQVRNTAVDSCPATEARLVSEFRRNPYARAVLLATMTRFQNDRGEQYRFLTEAFGLLRQASATEQKLLGMLPSYTGAGGASPSTTRKSPPASPSPSTTSLSSGHRVGTKTILVEPLSPPFLLSRSHTSVELLPAPFLYPSSSRLSKFGGSVGEEGNDCNARATLDSDAAFKAVTAPSKYRAKPKTAGTRVSKVCVYGKPEGAGTEVTLSNTRFAGLGVPIPYDPVTGVCGAVSIRGLTPNESYVFAVAAFDENGDLIGDGVGVTCAPVVTLNPLPLTLCWAQVSQNALALGFPLLAGQAAKEVYKELTIDRSITKFTAPRGGLSCSETCSGGRSATGNGWMESPLHGQLLNPKALAQCPRGILQAFVQACFILVETLDDDNISKAGGGAGEGAPFEEQVSRLISLKRLSLACEVTVLLQDWDLVLRGVWRAYHLFLPLLGMPAMGRLLFQILCQLHQCLALVPRDGWDSATRSVFACLAHQISIKGYEIGKQAAAVKTLLESVSDPKSPSAESTVFKEEHLDDEDKRGTPVSNHVSQQVALLEIWMGLQEYETEGEASSSLRSALALSVSHTASKDLAADKEQRGMAQDTANPPVTPLKVVEHVISEARKNPAKAWELLKGEALAGRPERAKLMCRVCRIALERGLAKKVISWLGQAVGSGNVPDGVGSTEENTGRSYLFHTSELEPLILKILGLEGALTNLMYIKPVATQAQNTDDGACIGNNIERLHIDETQDGGERESGLTTEDIRDAENSAEGRSQEDRGTIPTTSAECAQLLWLAEVEHILGAASMQLAFAAAPNHRPSKPQPKTIDAQPSIVSIEPPSKHTVEEESTEAAGGRRPWGYGSGPFASIAATAHEVIEQKWHRSDGQAEALLGNGDEEEGHIIEDMEDEGERWPSLSDIISTPFNSMGTLGDKRKDTITAVDMSAATHPPFSVYLSKAMLHLARAAVRASCGRFWLKTERACGLLWNAILSLWLSPQDFHPSCLDSLGMAQREVEGAIRLGEHHARAYAKACEALLDAVDALHGIRKTSCTGGMPGESDPGNASDKLVLGGENLEARKARGRSIQNEVDEAFSKTPGKNAKALPDLRWVTRFVEWGLQGIIRCRCWGVAVKVGSQLLASTDGLHAGHRVYPMIMYAQKRLCSLASGLLLKRQARLAALDEDFHKNQAQQRRRKVLKAVETKSKEEIEHEEARGPLVETADDAKARKQIHDHRFRLMLQSQDAYLNTKKIGRSSLDDAREALAEYLASFPRRSKSKHDMLLGKGGQSVASPVRFTESPNDDTYDKSDPGKAFNAVLQLYGRAVGILRDRREREFLAEALCDLGDLHALHGHYDLATRSWTDAIDGIFSALDSTKHWRLLFAKIRAVHSSSGGSRREGGSALALALGGWSCIMGGTVLGKLSAFAGQSDMGGQLNLCLMAAEMFSAPLETSLSFPQRACEYVSYTPEGLGGPGLEERGLWSDGYSLSTSAVHTSLMHVQEVLSAAGKRKEAFPVLAILEHIASKVNLDPRQLARVKLARVECSAEAGFPAEAASMLAAVLTGGGAPVTTADYAGRSCRLAKDVDPSPLSTVADAERQRALKKKGGGAKKGKRGTQPPDESAKIEPSPSDGSKRGDDSRQLAKSDLPFYGLSPYHDHLPLGHPENASAVKWLMGEGETSTDDTARNDKEDTVEKADTLPRHFRLLKRGLFGADLSLPELLGEHEACLVARARARLLLSLADCSMLPDMHTGTEGTGGDDAVLLRVRDATDAILGEILQVVMKRISPRAITRKSGETLESNRSGKSGTPASSSEDCHILSRDQKVGVVAATVAQIAATSSGKADGWISPLAADALLLRGRLALLDGKLRVCRHHASRGLAVLLRHGNGGYVQPGAFTTQVPTGNGSSKIDGNVGGDKAAVARVTFGDEQYQPWSVIQTWLELRYDLAVVALLQGRTRDAIFQIERGLEESQAVGEHVIAFRLRRLRAQASVAKGDLERAVSDCRTLVSDCRSETLSALDQVAVLRLYSEIRRQQSLVCGGSERRESLRLLLDSLEALRLADSTLVSAAKDMGWIGSGMLTYALREDNIMLDDAQPRLLHALSTSFQDVWGELSNNTALGMAPIDKGDIYTPSPLANLYLPTLRLLLSVRVSMLDLMQIIGYYNVAGDQSLEGGDEPSDYKGIGLTDELKEGARDNWLTTASSVAEETAAIMRHVANPHPAVRAHLLLLIGKFRRRRFQHLRDPLAVVPTSSSSACFSIDDVTCKLNETAETALKAALTVSFARGGHDSRVMTDACMELVLLYSPSHLLLESVDREEINLDGTLKDGTDNSKRAFDQASHFLRLAASISSGHRRLDAELETIGVEPLPSPVIDAMPRSALDELAGRGGRGTEDDPSRLTERCLLQFLRARMKEKSLAAAPYDLLPASAVCQIHALLYKHTPAYSEKCCIEEASIEPPMSDTDCGMANSVPQGMLCVQWVWTDPHDIGDMMTNFTKKGGQGLYPLRTAVVLLGPSACSSEGDTKMGNRKRGTTPCMVTTTVHAHTAKDLRRRASQLKALLEALANKASAKDSIPSSIQERFHNLLEDAAQELRRGIAASSLGKPLRRSEAVADPIVTEIGETASGDVLPSVANVEILERMFDTETGVSSENQELCRFVRVATSSKVETNSHFVVRRFARTLKEVEGSGFSSLNSGFANETSI